MMEMCQGIWNGEELLYAIHALAHSASERVTAIKKVERNCTELADVTGSLPALAGICSQRASWGIKGLPLAAGASMQRNARAQQPECGGMGRS